MTRHIWLSVGYLVTLLASPPVLAQERTSVERLTWLAGCWEASADRIILEEQWTSPDGGIMLGVNRSTQRGRLVGFEFLMIDGRDTALAFVAHPSGQATTTFRAAAISDDRVVFANPAHDFPQRIGYERRGDSLLAWIEGPGKEGPSRIEFPFVRVSCPGS